MRRSRRDRRTRGAFRSGAFLLLPVLLLLSPLSSHPAGTLAAQVRPEAPPDAAPESADRPLDDGATEQQRPPVGREEARALRFPPLEFQPPEVEVRTLSNGTRVLFLRDPTLPLVEFYARFRGGYALFDRRYYAAGMALPSLIRAGGTRTLPPDSVDRLMESHAFQTTFGSGGEGSYSSINTLTENVEAAVDLWGRMLRSPRFDSAEVEIWRGRSRESVRRRRDDPGRLAFSEFNRLMFGDHPTGWELEPADLDEQTFTRERLQWVHRRIFCTDNMILGVAGDISWARAEALLEEMLEDWPSCPEALPEPRPAEPRRERGVFLIPRDLNQSTVVLAEPSGVRRSTDEDYFASRIANSILGASGFTSRLMQRVRTEEGLAYSVSSVWTTPSESEGIVGAVTRTRAEATVPTIDMILDVFRDMTETPPAEDEVRIAIEEIVNGFVFNFESAGEIVSRKMLYLIQDLSEDWLERYVAGIQRVEPEDVHRVVREEVHPERMTILVVGDPERFEVPLDTLGDVRVLDGEDEEGEEGEP